MLNDQERIHATKSIVLDCIMPNDQEEIHAAERIVLDCLKGKVIENTDLELARKLNTEDLMKAVIMAIFSKQVEINQNNDRKVNLTAIGDMNIQKAECAYRGIELPSSKDERRYLAELRKTIVSSCT